jgi:hypothetical protein
LERKAILVFGETNQKKKIVQRGRGEEEKTTGNLYPRFIAISGGTFKPKLLIKRSLQETDR